MYYIKEVTNPTENQDNYHFGGIDNGGQGYEEKKSFCSNAL